MSAPVDVRVILEELAGKVWRENNSDPILPRADEALVALTELIEVVGLVNDAAVAHYGDAMALHLALSATGGLNERLSAALARVKGGDR